MIAAALPIQEKHRRTGLAFWMERVLEECDRASVDFAPDPVHDLRVAMRRCRSMADGLMAIDPDRAWKRMKKAGRNLFRSLGDLRDLQVMQEWVHHLDSPQDPVTSKLLQALALRESQKKRDAAEALSQFDRKQWRHWTRTLPRRARRMRPGSVVFKHLALERWLAAYDLHRRALRSRSQTAWHQLRIGVKRFRYIVENFLPEQHDAWSNDLKALQDWLGEVHDLDVLWATAEELQVFPDVVSRGHWHSRISEERARRVEKYRSETLGRRGLWQVWRVQLPDKKQTMHAAEQRLKLWASFLDPDFRHSTHVAKLALEIYDGLGAHADSADGISADHNRDLLRLAAWMHDVGRSRGEKAHHKASLRLIQNLSPPLGANAVTLHQTAIIARYHRGALPRAAHACLRGLDPAEKNNIVRLAGILRLADAFDAERDGRIHQVEVGHKNAAVVISAQGYSPRDRLAEDIAAGRHLLELAIRRPILVKSMPVSHRSAHGIPRRLRSKRGLRIVPAGTQQLVTRSQ